MEKETQKYNLEVRDLLVRTMKDNLPYVRKVLGVSQAGLGKTIGVSNTSISRIETCNKNLTVPEYVAIRYVIDIFIEDHPNDLRARKLCGLLDCNIDVTWIDAVIRCGPLFE